MVWGSACELRAFQVRLQLSTSDGKIKFVGKTHCENGKQTATFISKPKGQNVRECSKRKKNNIKRPFYIKRKPSQGAASRARVPRGNPAAVPLRMLQSMGCCVSTAHSSCGHLQAYGCCASQPCSQDFPILPNSPFARG